MTPHVAFKLAGRAGASPKQTCNLPHPKINVVKNNAETKREGSQKAAASENEPPDGSKLAERAGAAPGHIYSMPHPSFNNNVITLLANPGGGTPAERAGDSAETLCMNAKVGNAAKSETATMPASSLSIKMIALPDGDTPAARAGDSAESIVNKPVDAKENPKEVEGRLRLRTMTKTHPVGSTPAERAGVSAECMLDQSKTVDAAGSKVAADHSCRMEMKARARLVGSIPAERAGVFAGSSTKIEASVKRKCSELLQKIDDSGKKPKTKLLEPNVAATSEVGPKAARSKKLLIKNSDHKKRLLDGNLLELIGDPDEAHKYANAKLPEKAREVKRTRTARLADPTPTPDATHFSLTTRLPAAAAPRTAPPVRAFPRHGVTGPGGPRLD